MAVNMDAHKIIGENCGRDKSLNFLCICGKCDKLDARKRDNGDNSRYYRGESRNTGNNNSPNKPFPLRCFFRRRSFH